MKKFLAVTLLLLISFSLFGCGKAEIGEVTGSKTDEEAIKEVVTEYFKSIKNYEWDTYNKEDGLEFWTEEGKEDLLNDEKKLPNLEKSIKENEISRELLSTNINKVEIEGDTAVVEAVTEENSVSTDERFVGLVRSFETITLEKENEIWRISSRSAQITVIQNE